MSLSCRWLFDGIGPPIRDATIEIEQGIIQQIHTRRHEDVLNLGDVAIVPGLLNAHTHLEFSGLRTPIQPLDCFADWISHVIAYRRNAPFDVANVVSGMRESIASGVAVIGEIATTDWRLAVHPSSDATVIMFHEFLGLSEQSIPELLGAAKSFLQQANVDGVIPALSPHAPYSVHPQLLDGLVKLASEFQVPLAMHLAESPDERQLLDSGRGPLAELLTQLGVMNAHVFAKPRSHLDLLRQLECDAPTLIVHGNDLSHDEINFLAGRTQMSVVYCPRTHAAMQTGSHPWKAMLERGVNVVLGTDSRASNPDLSLWRELQFLKKRHPDFPDTELLHLVTRNAAHALRLQGHGTLQPGQAATLCVVELDSAFSAAAEDCLFNSASRPVATLLRGQWASLTADWKHCNLLRPSGSC